jgi:hypothetical protein
VWCFVSAFFLVVKEHGVGDHLYLYCKV